MKSGNALLKIMLGGLLLSGSPTGWAQGYGTDPRITLGQAGPLNHFGLSYRMGLNISAKFKNLGGFPALSDPGPVAYPYDHTYDDGYNRVDNNPHMSLGLTWNWGFNSPGQVVQNPAGYDLLVHSSSSPATLERGTSDDPQHGMELTYNRVLGRIDRSVWGLESAFNYSSLTFSLGGPIYGPLVTTTDAYALTDNQGQPVPPFYPPGSGIPYRGTATGAGNTGFGPLIRNFPSWRAITADPGGAMINGEYNFEADVFGFRLGPFLRTPINDRFSVGFSGGLAFAVINSDFNYNETVTIPGVGVSSPRSGSAKDRDVNVGAFAGTVLSYRLADWSDVFAGVQYQYLGDYTHKLNGKEVEVDLGEGIYVSVGIGFSF